MENLTGKYIFTHWIHNSGFQSRWLRRITRQTKKFLFSDVQYTLLLRGKYDPKNNKGKYFYGIIKKWAKKFYLKNDMICRSVSERDNLDGEMNILLVDNFEILKCPYSYFDLFEKDIRDMNIESKFFEKMLNSILEHNEFMKNIVGENFRENFKIKTEKIDSGDNLYGHIVNHMEDLFGLPVYIVCDFLYQLDTIHDEKSPYVQTAIHYHLNHFAGDKNVITSQENKKNCTISFWLFDDRVVFKTEDGIDSW